MHMNWDSNTHNISHAYLKRMLAVPQIIQDNSSMMASSGKETLDIKTVHQCNRCLGCKTLHPQASIIRLYDTNVEQHSIKFDFYTILLMENDIEDCCCCGRKAYDYSNATMVFLPPEKLFHIHKNRVLPQQGWLLAFHPICFMVPHLKKTFKNILSFSTGKRRLYICPNAKRIRLSNAYGKWTRNYITR